MTAELDAGQVLTQAMLAVDHSESAEALQARVQKLEHQVLPWTILLIAQGVLNLDAINGQKAATPYLPQLPLKLWLDD